MEASGPYVVEHARPSMSRLSFVGWPLRWKVAAIMVLPVLLAATFGALRIQNELSAASKLSVASGDAAIVVPAVEFVDQLDGLGYAAASGAPIQEPLAQFDASATNLQSVTTSAEFNPTVITALATASSTAKTLRDEMASGRPVPPLQIAEQAQSVANSVASAIATTTATVRDSAVQALSDRLVNGLAAQRALTTQRVLAAAPDFADSDLLRTKAAEAKGAETAAIDRLAQLGESVSPGADEYHAMLQQLSSDLERTVHARANTLQSAALRDTAIILGAVLTALVVALGVGRSLIRSIGSLRRGALDVAQVQLPEEIERLSKGGGVPEIAALPVQTHEEVGQLARAIDDIHFQAVRLAGEHGVRLQIGEMFETLSRRSRSLVEEQLSLIETLELDEDDPVRLDHLFRLDHLATRMRRNGDNLLVLADTVERHRRSGPAPLLEVLHAAMSEVEQYRRVTIGATGDVSIVGAAAGDVGHLIAELLDNALRYSPPESLVSVTVSRAVDAGILVEVADRGLGMSAEDLRAANERLALGGEVTSETAKRMGLFVVGRLAGRHDAIVRLRATDALNVQPGVTASVYLPGTLTAPTEIVETRDDPLARPLADAPLALHELATELDDVAASAPAEEYGPATTRDGSTLPKRSPGASGVNRVAAAENGASERPSTSNTFAYFTNRPTPEALPSQNLEPESSENSESAPIYERMVSEWLMDPTTLESRNTVWATAADDGWAAAAQAVEQKPQRHTESGLPIRERGARLVPGHASNGSDAGSDESRDPAAAGALLSRALAGVRSGRAESSAAHRRIEGDE